MILDRDDIENILHIIPNSYGLIDMLAPQEVKRLSELIYDVLFQASENARVNAHMKHEEWSKIIKRSLLESLENSKLIFGNLNLSNMLNIDELIKNMYYFESGEYLKNKNQATSP